MYLHWKNLSKSMLESYFLYFERFFLKSVFDKKNKVGSIRGAPFYSWNRVIRYKKSRILCWFQKMLPKNNFKNEKCDLSQNLPLKLGFSILTLNLFEFEIWNMLFLIYICRAKSMG